MSRLVLFYLRVLLNYLASDGFRDSRYSRCCPQSPIDVLQVIAYGTFCDSQRLSYFFIGFSAGYQLQNLRFSSRQFVAVFLIVLRPYKLRH